MLNCLARFLFKQRKTPPPPNGLFSQLCSTAYRACLEAGPLGVGEWGSVQPSFGVIADGSANAVSADLEGGAFFPAWSTARFLPGEAESTWGRPGPWACGLQACSINITTRKAPCCEHLFASKCLHRDRGSRVRRHTDWGSPGT